MTSTGAGNKKDRRVMKGKGATAWQLVVASMKKRNLEGQQTISRRMPAKRCPRFQSVLFRKTPAIGVEFTTSRDRLKLLPTWAWPAQ